MLPSAGRIWRSHASAAALPTAKNNKTGLFDSNIGVYYLRKAPLRSFEAGVTALQKGVMRMFESYRPHPQPLPLKGGE